MASSQEAVAREGALSSPRKMFMASKTTPPTSPLKSPSGSAKSFSFAVDETSSGGMSTILHGTDPPGARACCALLLRS